MNLDDAQKAAVRKWVEEGLKLSEIQNRLETEFGLIITYMEARFLLDDLKVAPKDAESEPEPQPQGAETPAGNEALAPEEAPLPGEDPLAPGGSGVSVTVDQLTRAGAMISGKVTFSDGKTADWYLDQMGRLGVAAQEQGYKPTQMDLMAFQTELQKQLARMGYA